MNAEVATVWIVYAAGFIVGFSLGFWAGFVVADKTRK